MIVDNRQFSQSFDNERTCKISQSSKPKTGQGLRKMSPPKNKQIITQMYKNTFKYIKTKLGVVAHACNPHTWKLKAGESSLRPDGLHNLTLSQTNYIYSQGTNN
jgi:hypothetical protein